MRKILIALLLVSISTSLLISCNNQSSPTNTNEQNIPDENSVAIFKGIIEEITDTTAIIIPNDDQEHILSSGDKVIVNLSVSDTEFIVGDEVIVYYTGDIMESYPLRINTIDVKLSEDFE